MSRHSFEMRPCNQRMNRLVTFLITGGKLLVSCGARAGNKLIHLGPLTPISSEAAQLRRPFDLAVAPTSVRFCRVTLFASLYTFRSRLARCRTADDNSAGRMVFARGRPVEAAPLALDHKQLVATHAELFSCLRRQTAKLVPRRKDRAKDFDRGRIIGVRTKWFPSRLLDERFSLPLLCFVCSLMAELQMIPADTQH